jgi:hypothetical protein
MKTSSRLQFAFGFLLAVGCGTPPGEEVVDNDGDGIPQEQDCNDFDANVSPDADEVCDNTDNNCDGEIDEGFDNDNDNFTTCEANPDCNDNDPNINPFAPDPTDGIDNNCNGFIDDLTVDTDGDGTSPDQGDCNDQDPLVSPDAVEVGGDEVDNDCNCVADSNGDGVFCGAGDDGVDEALIPCDTDNLDPNNAFDYAKAIGLCRGEVTAASFVSGINASRNIVANFGSGTGPLNVPTEGTRMIVLSNGSAGTGLHDNGTAFDGSFANGGTAACQVSNHPATTPQVNPAGGCAFDDPAEVCDKLEVSFTIQVPPNAESFTFDFKFFSSEYPTFRCTAFDDTFLAELNSGAFNGNISFDSLGNFVSVNNGFFDECIDDTGSTDINGDGFIDPNFEAPFRPVAVPPNDCTVEDGASLANTGYIFNNTPDPFDGDPFSEGAGSTLRLTTTSPVVPGETITLRFIIFDEGDDVLDSTVTIDNFVWQGIPAEGPVTKIP